MHFGETDLVVALRFTLSRGKDWRIIKWMADSRSVPDSACDPVAVQHARDLEAPARAWLQRIFGRTLRDDEDITIVLTTAHHAPSAADRKAALESLERVLDKSAANLQGVSEADFDEAVGEAMKHVRPTFEP